MAERVTVESFTRAETDLYLARGATMAGGTGRLHHNRRLMPVDDQTVVRTNRDTLYSEGVFDLDAGPVTFELPDAGSRFLSLIVIDQDHYLPLPTLYAPGTLTVDRETVGTRYVMAGVRTGLVPGDAADLKRAHQVQDSLVVRQAGPGRLELPDWDETSRATVRAALIALADTLPDSRRMFGPRDAVDPVRHLLGTASGWGGNPETDALYIPVTPERNDGVTVHRLVVGDVPVDAFWSLTVYGPDGYLVPNDRDAYVVSSANAERGPDGTVTVQLGGDPADCPNHLPVSAGWNYWVRLYRPRQELLDGTWTFPRAEPVPG